MTGLARAAAFARRAIAAIAPDVFIFAVVALVFAPAAVETFLNLDDFNYVAGCPFVKDGLSAGNIRAAFRTLGHGGIWMPLTSVTYMADITLFGPGWKPHHVVNVLLHAVNAVLLFRLLAALAPRFAGKVRVVLPCMAAALLWALNPERSEAVAWVASRKEELWALFALSGLLAWRRHVVCGSAESYSAAFALFVLSCLCKPTAMAFPLLAMAVDWLVSDPCRGRAQWRLAAMRYVPMFAVSAAVGAIAVYSQSHPEGQATVELFSAPFWWRALNASVTAGLHIFHAVVPVGVYADSRVVPDGWPLESAKGLLALAAAVAGLVFVMRRRPTGDGLRRVAPFAAFWFLAAFAPVSGIFGAVGDNAIAPRYSYVPAMGLAALFAWGAAALSARRGMAVAAGCAAALATVFAALSLPVTRSYATDASLAARTLRCDPDNWRALRTLGRERAGRDGRLDEGVELLRKSLRLRPSRLTADILAYTLACRGGAGDFAEVRRLARHAMRNPRNDPGGMALDALGIAAMREGDDRTAVAMFSASLAAPMRSYSNWHTLLNFALSLANAGRRVEAVENLLKLSSVRDEGVRSRALDALDAVKNHRPGRLEWKPD